MAQETNPEPTIIRAPLHVTDPNGAPLLSLTMEEHGPRLALFDYYGRPRIRLDANGEHGAVLELLADDGRPVVEVYDLGRDAGGSLSLNHPADAEPGMTGARVVLAAEKRIEGDPLSGAGITIHGTDAPSLVRLGEAPGGGAMLLLSDQATRERIRLWADRGAGYVAALRDDGMTAAALYADDNAGAVDLHPPGGDGSTFTQLRACGPREKGAG